MPPLMLTTELLGGRTMISAPTPRARARLIAQRSFLQAHQRQNQRHLNADDDDPNQRPDRTVLQVFENQFIGQVCCKKRPRYL